MDSFAQLSLFPYKYRQNQEEIVGLFLKALNERGHLVLESGTGSGKTICALAPCVQYAIGAKKRILYLTRTNSQQHQVLSELRMMSRVQKVFGVAIQGRKNMCPLVKSDERFAESTAEELSLMCSDLKKKTTKAAASGIGGGEDGKSGGDVCKYYANACSMDTSEIRARIKEGLPTAEEVMAFCEKEEICPYEFNKFLVSDALVVVAPYAYFFETNVRRHLLEWMGCTMGDIILIVDEAHNIPEYCRESGSVELSCESLRLAQNEAKEFGDPVVAESRPARPAHGAGLIIEETKITPSMFCAELAKIIRSLARHHIEDEDALLPPSAVEAELMQAFAITSTKLKELLRNMVLYGEVVRDAKRKSKKLPRSYNYNVGGVMSAWFAADGEVYIKLVKGRSQRGGKGAEAGEGNPKIEMYCMDPSVVAKPILECWASAHMSGTLAPLDEYRDSMGLPSLDALPSGAVSGAKSKEALAYKEAPEFKDAKTQGTASKDAKYQEHSPNSAKDAKDQSLARNPASSSPEAASKAHMAKTMANAAASSKGKAAPASSAAILARYPSPFPPQNREVFYDVRLTTRYEDLQREDEKFIASLEDEVVKIANGFDRNTVFFFPSYALLSRFVADGVMAKVKRDKYLEEPHMGQDELMSAVDKFKAIGNSVLFAVIGGRISEGIDFPAEQLEIAVLVGVPYPKPTAKQRAMQYYYDVKFKKGWEYTVHAPTARKMLQAIGRLIRTETDRGVGIILDKRAVHFKEQIENLKGSGNVVVDTKNFFMR